MWVFVHAGTGTRSSGALTVAQTLLIPTGWISSKIHHDSNIHSSVQHPISECDELQQVRLVHISTTVLRLYSNSSDAVVS